jgi:hypothetical protein
MVRAVFTGRTGSIELIERVSLIKDGRDRNGAFFDRAAKTEGLRPRRKRRWR